MSSETAAPAPRKMIGKRFRGFLPVVVDVETGGFNCKTDALLEVAAVPIGVDEHGSTVLRKTVRRAKLLELSRVQNSIGHRNDGSAGS